MNLDICKKCLRCNFVNFYYSDIYSSGRIFYYITIKGYPFKSCIVKPEKVFEDKNEVINIIKSNHAEDYFKIDNNCPYYAEHKLIEWNKNES